MVENVDEHQKVGTVNPSTLNLHFGKSGTSASLNDLVKLVVLLRFHKRTVFKLTVIYGVMYIYIFLKESQLKKESWRSLWFKPEKLESNGMQVKNRKTKDARSLFPSLCI